MSGNCGSKHLYPAQSLYCKRCKQLSEARARTFVGELMKARKTRYTINFGSRGEVMLRVLERPAESKMADLKAHLLTQIKPSMLMLEDGVS